MLFQCFSVQCVGAMTTSREQKWRATCFGSKLFFRSDSNKTKYWENVYQYSYSSNADAMKPFAILYPKDEATLIAAIKLAASEKCHLSIRSGGHQYSGASSTAGDNIQIDVSELYDECSIDSSTGLVRVGVGRTLDELNLWLGNKSLFVLTRPRRRSRAEWRLWNADPRLRVIL